MNPLDYAKKICYSTEEVLQFTYDMAVKYKDWNGIFIECGVAAGAQIIAMAAGAPGKTIYAFDSFEGIPLPSNKDDQLPGIRYMSKQEIQSMPEPGKQVLESSGATCVSEEVFWGHICTALEDVGHEVYPIKGWFEETVPNFCQDYKFPPSTGIDILRLDGDLYYSTYVCLKYLYPRMSDGGLIIIDDWALLGCRSAVRDYLIEIGEESQDIKFIHSGDSIVAHWTV